MPVVSESADGAVRVVWTLDELLPDAFGPATTCIGERLPERHRGGRRPAERRQVDARERAGRARRSRSSPTSRRPPARDIRAILTTDEAQIVFTDTPGFHKPRTLLGSRLNDLVGDAVEGVDVS